MTHTPEPVKFELTDTRLGDCMIKIAEATNALP